MKQTDRKRMVRLRMKPRNEYFYVPVKTAETIPRVFEKNSRLKKVTSMLKTWREYSVLLKA